MPRAKTTIRQLAAEAGASPEDAMAFLKSAGISVTHPHDAVPRGRPAGARAALGWGSAGRFPMFAVSRT